MPILLALRLFFRNTGGTFVEEESGMLSDRLGLLNVWPED
jgi:hypothetical protein